MLGKACRLDDATGCFQLGAWHDGSGRSKEAATAWTKVCSSGHDGACGELTRIGAPVPSGAPTPAEAHANHLRACEGNEPIGCAQVADDYRYGRGVTPNQETAQAYDVRACFAEFPASCKGLGQRFADRGELEEADRYYAKACDLGDYSACAEAGFLRRTLGRGRDVRTPRELFERGCKANNAASCFGLGGEIETAKRPQTTIKALTAYERACDGRHAQACVAAARLSSGAKARRLRAQACKLGLKHACAPAPAPGAKAQSPKRK